VVISTNHQNCESQYLKQGAHLNKDRRGLRFHNMSGVFTTGNKVSSVEIRAEELQNEHSTLHWFHWYRNPDIFKISLLTRISQHWRWFNNLMLILHTFMLTEIDIFFLACNRGLSSKLLISMKSAQLSVSKQFWSSCKSRKYHYSNIIT